MNRSVSSHVLGVLLVLGGATTGLAQRDAYPVWQFTDTEPGDSSCSKLLALADGDVICAGSFPSATGQDLVVTRIDEQGGFAWVTHVANPHGSGGVTPSKMLLSPRDEIVLMCQVTGDTTVSDFYFLSLDPDDGHLIADRTIDHFDWDLPVDMEIGPSGSILACGHGIDPDQYLAMKLDPSLQTLWEVNLGNVAQDYQHATDLAIAANGDVLVAGEVYDGVQGDVRVDRLTTSGTLVYSKDFGDPAFDDWEGILHAGPAGTYFAFRKAALEPTAEARLYRLDQAGNVTWGIVDPVALAWVEIQEIENEEFIIAGVGPFSLGSAQTFRKFDELGNNLGTLILPTPGYEHNWISDMTVGPDGIIYTLAHATPNGGGGMDWFINALSVDGGLVYQWTLDAGDVDSFDLPDGLVALGHGRIVASGWIDNQDYDAHLVTLQALLTEAPDAVTLLDGRLVRGDVDSLSSFDGDVYEVTRASNGINSAASPVAVEIETTLPSLYPKGSLAFAFTARTSTLGLTQTLELWNWTTGAWDRATPSDSSTSYATEMVLGSVTDHIEAATGRVKARCTVSAPAQIMNANWRLLIERAAWLVQP